MIEIAYFLLAVLYIYGLYNLFDYETTLDGRYDGKASMVFGWIAFHLDKLLGLPYTKPLYSCMPCMASLHGFIFYMFSPLHFTTIGVLIWIVALSGAMKLMTKL